MSQTHSTTDAQVLTEIFQLRAWLESLTRLGQRASVTAQKRLVRARLEDLEKDARRRGLALS